MRFQTWSAAIVGMVSATAAQATNIYVGSDGAGASAHKLLDPGTYALQLVDGAIDTITSGVQNHGCDAQDEHCEEGYYSRFTVALPGRPLIYSTDIREIFGSIAQSEDFYAALPPLTFSLTGTTDVHFAIAMDEGHQDRHGHMDLDLELQADARAVPEPATWAMFVGGFGLAGAAMRRRPPATRLA